MVRGPGTIKSTTFLWQIALTVTCSLCHFTAARSKALHWGSNFLHHFHVGFCRHYDDWRTGFNTASLLADLDGSWAYVVVARSFRGFATHKLLVWAMAKSECSPVISAQLITSYHNTYHRDETKQTLSSTVTLMGTTHLHLSLKVWFPEWFPILTCKQSPVVICVLKQGKRAKTCILFI